MIRMLIPGLILMWASVAHADVLNLPNPTSTTAELPSLPSRGTSMADVKRRYGAPLATSSAGGSGPKQPLINRWDYDGFSVFFEKQLVIDSVTPGRPPPVAHRDALIRE